MEKLPKTEKTPKKRIPKALLGAAIISSSFMPSQEAGSLQITKEKVFAEKDAKKIEASAPAKKERKPKKNISFEEAKLAAQINQKAEENQEPSEETQTEGQISAEIKKEITVPFSIFVENIRDSIAKHAGGEISVKTFEIKKEGGSFSINAELKAWGLFTINLSGKIINSIKATPGGSVFKTLEITDLKIDASLLVRKKAEEMIKTNLTFAIPFLVDQLRTQYQTTISELEIDESGNLKLTK